MEHPFDDAYTRYQSERSALRKFVRKLYLKRAAAQLQGKTLDFGCGVGELLQWLPAGSRGVEYNRATVDHCRARGLDVQFYDGTTDGWSLSMFGPGDGFRSMVVSHVLEHLDEPRDVLRRLLDTAVRLGMRDVLVIVPGRAGFRIDPTHRVLVDEAMIRDAVTAPWRVEKAFRFPFDWERVGDVFVYNELHVKLRRGSD
jgi:SAM-dependent methyltransferase